MPEIPSPEKIGGVIPYFYYDLIGRIGPGAFILFGILCLWRGNGFLSGVYSVLLEPHDDGTVWQIAQRAAVYFCISALLGFIVSSPSKLLLDKVLWSKCFRRQINIQGLRGYLGARDAGDLELFTKLFGDQFGISIETENQDLERNSFLCAYYVWRRDPNLGAMTAKFDAELLGAQNLLFGSSLLALGAGARMLRDWHPFNHLLAMGGFVTLCLITACLVPTFDYHRRKRIYGRIALYISLHRVPSSGNTDQKERSVNHSADTGLR